MKKQSFEYRKAHQIQNRVPASVKLILASLKAHLELEEQVFGQR